jgi:hypothetical protein
MTISRAKSDLIGPRVFAPEGPYQTANWPLQEFSPGEWHRGDGESKFVFVTLPIVASVTVNQGDWVVWDNSYAATLTATGAGAHPFGASCGVLYFGGRVAASALAPIAGNAWTYTLTAGIYGVWVQVYGTAVAGIATVNAQTKPLNTTAVAGRVDAPAAALAGSMGIASAFACPTSFAFTGTTTIGSVNLTAASTNKGLVIGQTLTGTGVATGAVIKDIQGPIVVMSLAATAAGTVTITAANNSFVCTTTNLSPNLTNVTSIAGIYPNQTVTGTGIVGTIVSILGNAAPYTIVMSSNSTATANNIAATTALYIEAFLKDPLIAVQN